MSDVYLIDGSGYAYRAFYAIANLTDPEGRPTGAIFGFLKMLLKLMREKDARALAVVFDTGKPTARHAMYPAYKANRTETPEDLIAQFPLILKAVEALGVPVFAMDGYEADDVLATLAVRAAAEGRTAYIVSSDKDMLQLVSDQIKVYDPVKDTLIGPAEVTERFSVGPERVTEYMALVGDTADNIPGVKGIGDKTARELLARFTSLDEMVERAGEIEKPRLRSLVTGGVDALRLSKRLVEIDREVPVDARMEDLIPREPRWDELREMFTALRFTSLMPMLPERAGAARTLEAVRTEARLAEILRDPPPVMGMDTETTGIDAMVAGLVGFSVSRDPGHAAYIPLAHTDGSPQIPRGAALGLLRAALCHDGAPALCGHNLKYDLIILHRAGVRPTGKLIDTMVASYLLNPGRAEHSLAQAGLNHLGKTKRAFTDVLGARASFADVPVDEATPYGAEDAGLTLELWEALEPKLHDAGLTDVFQTIEMPLVSVLTSMEEAGMMIDSGKLGSYGAELEREMAAVAQRVYFHAGREFNINSPKQLGEVLFEDLGLRPGRKKKTGFSTDVGVLEGLAAVHPLPAEVLQWRTLAKLKNTYVDVLPRLVNPSTGRVHTSFNQCVTATGRLSSSEPNLQNIPVRGEWGTRVRSCFIAPAGSALISADYSQIELRVLAHLSEDEALVEAFQTDTDIHSLTASELFGVDVGRVDAEMRRAAKTVNFGVIYGMSAFGLSESLGIPRAEAERYIAQYFAAHPGVSALFERIIAEAADTGMARTMFGRMRPVPELKAKNRAIRQQGERIAVNTTVQGTAADIIKLAMVRIDRALHEQKMNAQMILQVHDELLVEAPEAEVERARAAVDAGMCGAADLRVPLKIAMGHGPNWAEAH